MKKWNIYKKESGEIEVVKNGFNWWAFFFIGIWAFTKRLTLAGVIGLAISITLNRIPTDAIIITLPLTLILMLVYGFMGNNWVAAKLEKQKYSFIKQVEAASVEGAKAQIAVNLSITPKNEI